jgi:S1-C subfamily serine protease
MRLRFFLLCSGLAVVTLPTVMAQSHTATKPAHSAPTMTPNEMFKKVSQSVFVIEAVDTHGEVLFQQSGVAISSHVIASTKTILGTFANITVERVHRTVARYRLRQGYRTWSVEKVSIDSQRDVSTFESPDVDAQPAQTLKFDAINVGERIYAVSFPKGQEETLTTGAVSGLDSVESATPIHTTISLAAESAGGGLFDANGKLVGLVAFSLDASLNTGVPSEWLQRPRIVFSGAQSPDRHSEATHGLMQQALIVSNNIATFARAAMAHQGKVYTENEESSAVTDALDGAVMLGLIDKDAPENYDNWPVWRQAVANMELLRAEIDSASESGGMEGSESSIEEISSRNLRTFVDGGRKKWSEVLDEYCKEVPGGPYTDLDGKERACAPGQ